jgi:hypothetical protein
MEQLIPFISDVGFPIVVTLYLLHRIEAKLDNVVQSIQGLPARLQEKHETIKPIYSDNVTQKAIHEVN